VSREHLPWMGVAVVLLLGGLVIGLRFRDTSDGATTAQSPETGRELFRQWFWESRTLDLAVQVGLIFVGALGIAALLPGSEEEDGE
jgi:hypothetical protein